MARRSATEYPTPRFRNIVTDSLVYMDRPFPSFCCCLSPYLVVQSHQSRGSPRGPKEPTCRLHPALTISTESPSPPRPRNPSPLPQDPAGRQTGPSRLEGQRPCSGAWAPLAHFGCSVGETCGCLLYAPADRLRVAPAAAAATKHLRALSAGGLVGCLSDIHLGVCLVQPDTALDTRGRGRTYPKC